MKKIAFLFLTMSIVFSCDNDKTFDCFQTSGPMVQSYYEVPSFSKILVNRDVELIISQDEVFTVLVETGENLLSDIMVNVVNDELILTDNNNCNYVRDFGITKVYVTAPDLTQIRSSTQYDISSNGVLSYNELSLISEDFNYPDSYTVGDFRLDLASQNVSVAANNLSFFYLSGTVSNIFIGFYAGAGRFEGEDLIAQDVRVYHRGSNDMVVNAQLSLTGQLLGTGNLISVSTPAQIDIDQIYTGQLIFN